MWPKWEQTYWIRFVCEWLCVPIFFVSMSRQNEKFLWNGISNWNSLCERKKNRLYLALTAQWNRMYNCTISLAVTFFALLTQMQWCKGVLTSIDFIMEIGLRFDLKKRLKELLLLLRIAFLSAVCASFNPLVSHKQTCILILFYFYSSRSIACSHLVSHSETKRKNA